jgi:hypothetical protein
MHRLQKLKKYILYVFISLTILTTSVWANNGEQTQVGSLSFKWFQISAPFDFNNFGVLKGIGYLMTFFVMWMVIWTFWLLIKVAWKMILSRGDSGAVESAMNTGRELWKGTVVFFLWLSVYIAVSFWIGVGNLFQWPEALTQCGDGTPYFQAEYNARQLLRENGYTFNDDYEYKNLSYCCDSPSARNVVSQISDITINPVVNGTSPYAFWASNGTNSVVYINIEDESSEGWLFINIPDTVAPLVKLNSVENNCRAIFD